MCSNFQADSGSFWIQEKNFFFTVNRKEREACYGCSGRTMFHELNTLKLKLLSAIYPDEYWLPYFAEWNKVTHRKSEHAMLGSSVNILQCKFKLF